MARFKFLSLILLIHTFFGISECIELGDETREESPPILQEGRLLSREEVEAGFDRLPQVELEPIKPETEQLRGPELKVTESLFGRRIFRDDFLYHLEDLAPEISIQYKGTKLNVAMTKEEKEKKEEELAVHLYGQTLEERVAVWVKMANISALVTSYETGQKVDIPDTIEVADIGLSDEDIVYDLYDITEREEEILGEIELGVFPKQKPQINPTLVAITRKPTFHPILRTQPMFEIEDGRGRALQKREATESDAHEYAQDHAKSRQKRKMRDSNKWDLPIKYKFGNSMSSSEQQAIRDAIDYWQSLTCITFQYSSSVGWPKSRIVFYKISTGSGICGSSPVGKRRFGMKNQINIACFDLGTIVHEIGHSLGYWHEHSRPDRDNYVTIHWDNIPSSYHHNMGRHAAVTYSINYDYTSIMHYSSSYGGSAWITAKEPWYTRMMGSRIGLSFYDVKLMNYHYCSTKCGDSSLTWSSCQNGGYRDPKSCSKCRCPIGWKGTYCQSLDTKTACGTSNLIASATPQYLNSPNYLAPSGHYSQNDHCAWRIVAPAGHHVVARFVGQFDIRNTAHCDTDWVEVRYRDMTSPGPRFCGWTLPSHTFTSDQAHLMVVFRANGPTSSFYRGFRLEYKTETCGLCDYSYSPQPACRSVVSYTASTKYYVRCGWWRRCARYSYYTAYKLQDTCCHGQLVNGNCQVSGCGGCQDTLVKNQPKCTPYYEIKYKWVKTYTRCGFLGWRRCTKYKKVSYKALVNPEPCCAGFNLVGNRCIKP